MRHGLFLQFRAKVTRIFLYLRAIVVCNNNIKQNNEKVIAMVYNFADGKEVLLQI